MSFDAPAGSRLASLRERREAALAALFIDLPVPRIDPPLWVRYGAIKQPNLAGIMLSADKADGKGDKTAMLRAHINILTETVISVFERNDDGEAVSPVDGSSDLPNFGNELAKAYGLEDATAADIVRAIYITDGDIINVATKVSKFGGFGDDDKDDPGK